ncbi:MAG: TldD/PmbA family protein [Elusimicrobia bacterium]|nr:TldD/PmbA family protein [Elusimicrobiota bacterium]
MEKLLEMAAKAADQAEVYAREGRSSEVVFENAELHDIKGEMASGLSLRVIKGGRLGFAHTRNMKSREELLANALAALGGGVEALFDFPSKPPKAALKTFDPGIEGVSSADLVEECGRLTGELKAGTRGEIAAGAYSFDGTLRIANTRGLDVWARASECGQRVGAIFPGSACEIGAVFKAKALAPAPRPMLDQVCWLFNAGQRAVEPPGGRMKVLFMPEAMLTLAWRVMHGASARSVYEKVSPLADKVGERVFSPEFTVTDDATDDLRPGARPFDDEGVSTERLVLVEKGVFKGFYNDLNYAKKLGEQPTGHGYRTAMWGGDPLELKPFPWLSHLRFEPGKKTLRELVAMMDRGIILCGALGPHSGNIPNGDYSVGVAPGLYVERGEILGRVKDAMVSGNVYETLKNVVALGDTPAPAMGGLFPPLLCDNVSVTC